MNRRPLVGLLVGLVVVSGALVAPPAYAANVPAVKIVQSVRDARSASTESAASQVAVRFNHPVVIDSKTTPTQEVSALPDGTFQLVENTVPVRVKTPTGWTPLDSNLTTASDGLLAPKAADTPVEFGAGGDTVLARIRTKTGKWLDESSPFGTLPRPTIDGAAATYPDVLPGVDLRLTATAQGMSEVLIIKSATAAANPLLKSVQFGVSGSALASNVSGIAKATASDGSSVLSTSPTWWDSSNGSTADGPAGNASAEPVTQSSAGSKISLNAQAATSSRAVQYPVFVDPDWTGGLQAYTYVDLAYQTQSYWDGQYATGQQRTGYVAASYSSDNRNHTARSLWQVDTTGVKGKHILAATFAVTEDWSFNCTPSEVDLYWSGGISPSTTWNSQPGLIQYLSNAVVAHGHSSSCPTSAVGFSATAGVQAAANINATGLTLELKAANEGVSSSWKRFTQAATITITYNTPPNNPSAATYTSPSQSCSTSSTAPTYLDGTQPIGLGVTATDADAGQNVNTAFYVYNSSGAQAWTGGVSTSAQGARSVTIPANTLATGAYSWDARNGDLIDLSPGFSARCYFYITTVAPAPPGVTQTSTGNVVVGKPITVSFTSLAANQVKEFAYWWAPGPATNPATTTLTGGVLAPCDSTSGAVTFVCPDASGTKSGISVAPVDDLSTLWVVSFNAAGRVSVDSGGHYAATGLTVNANPDTTAVSFKSGHEWNMDSSDAPLYFDETVADSNENAEDLYNNDWTANDLLWVDADSTTSDVYGPPPTTVLKFWGHTVLWFWTLPSSTTYLTLTENQSPPSGYQYASPHGLGYGILPYTGGAAPENSQTLYSCALAGGQMTSLSATCEGNAGAATPLGYIYSSAAAVPSHFTARHLWRCTFEGKYKTAPDYNDSAVAGDACYDDSNAGWTYDVSLGWAASYDDTSTYEGVVDSTKSFTANAWVNPDVMVSGRTHVIFAQIASDFTGSGYVMQVDPTGHLEFCVSAQVAPKTTDCAVDASPLNQGDWAMVTGVWDSANHQVRLLVGDSTVAVSSSAHVSPPGDTTAAGEFSIGATWGSQGVQYGQWNGLIANPAVFPGVIDSNELFDLYTDQPLPDPAP